jgi:3-hydroxybutyryl-CoA dehydrogenase
MDKVAVIGAGTMGHSLAQVFAQGGYRVSLNDVSEEILGKARRLIKANLDTLAEASMFDPKRRDEVADKRIEYTTDLARAVEGAGLVIEAIIENQLAKKELFSQLDRLAPAEAILASNTSYLDIYQFVEINRPDKVIIAHWFAPPHIIPLVEIVPGPETSDQTVERIKKILDDLDKKTIVIRKFLPGFIVNRLQSAVNLEVYRLIDEGYVTPEEIDVAVKASYALRMPIVGLVKKIDFTGLDMVQRGLANKSYRPPEVRGKAEVIDKLVAQGRLGAMVGRGFYDYGGRSTEELFRERDLKLLGLMKLLREMGEL